MLLVGRLQKISCVGECSMLFLLRLHNCKCMRTHPCTPHLRFLLSAKTSQGEVVEFSCRLETVPGLTLPSSRAHCVSEATGIALGDELTAPAVAAVIGSASLWRVPTASRLVACVNKVCNSHDVADRNCSNADAMLRCHWLP